MAGLENILEQVLQLSDRERGELVAHLLRSLEPEDADELADAEWDAAWRAELDRRIRSIRDGSVELIDGDEARARVRAAIATRGR